MSGEVKRKIKLSRRFRIALSILSGASLMLFAALIYFSFQLEPIVASRLKETINTATNGLYRISFSNVHLNPFTGSVRFDNIVFTPNDSIHQVLKGQNLHPTHLYSLRIKSLALRRVHPIKVYFNRDLQLKALHILNPVIKVYYQHPRENDTEPEDKRTAWQRLSKYLRSIKVEDINLDNIDFQYIDKSSGKPKIDGVKNLSINIHDLLIDSASQADTTRFYFTKEIFVKVKNHHYQSRNRLYNIYFDEVNISAAQKYALIKNLQVVPRYGEMEFSKYLKERKARMQFHLNKALLQSIDFKHLITKRQLRASSLTLMGANLNVYLDLRKKRPNYDRGYHFPQVALKRMELNTLIDTVSFLNASLNYSEYTPVTARRGKLFFNKVNGDIFNFTNDTTAMKKDKWMRTYLSAMFFGKTKLNMNMNFNLLSPREEYNYTGSLGVMNAKNFNQLSRPLALLRINSGKIENAHFSVQADYRKSHGKLLLNYRDLNIGLLRIDENKVLRKQMLRSLVANNILLKESNPDAGGKLRIGHINYHRPDSIAFFGNLWQSIYTGMRETIGLTPERERALINQFKGINSKTEAERDRIRSVRKVRRLERRGRN